MSTTKKTECDCTERPSGVSLRDWFARKAMAEMVLVYLEIETHVRASSNPWISALARQVDVAAEACGMDSFEHMATTAYYIADAMIVARQCVSSAETGEQ